MTRTFMVIAAILCQLAIDSRVSFSFEGETDVPALLDALRNGTKDERGVAAAELARRREKSVAVSLRNIFLDPKEIEVARLEALRLWLALGDDATTTVSALERTAKSRRNSILVRVAAIQAQAAMARGPHAERVAEFMLTVVRDKDEAPELRDNAAAILCAPQVISESILQSFFQVLNDREEGSYIRLGLIKSLSLTIPSTTDLADDFGTSLLRLAADNDEALHIRIAALDACSTLEIKPSQLPETYRIAASQCLKMLKSQRMHRRVRIAAGDLLAGCGVLGADAVPQLIDLLKSEDTFLYECVVTSLGNIGKAAKASVPVLKQLIERRDATESIRTAARDALMLIEE